MLEVVYRDSVKDFTLEQAVECYNQGICIAVDDGKDITIIFEEEK